jgi:S-formylglutathione hydrolase FrmB
MLLAPALLFLISSAAAAAPPVTFKVTLGAGVAASDAPVSGRLLVFMRKSDKPLESISPDFTDPLAVYVTGTEVANLKPGEAITIDAESESFPAAFSAAPAGAYQVYALLDRDHSYTYDGPGAGDICSKTISVTMPAESTAITLSDVSPDKKVDVPPYVRVIDLPSPRLTAFWGRPMSIQATVMLPPGYDTSKKKKYPTVYVIHGYGGDHMKMIGPLAAVSKLMGESKIPEMIYVALNAHTSLGHHVFADSANNGPWGTALVEEFIPHLERQFRMDAKPSGRFLNGHSSGGWSTLWVMVTHPDFFGGTWSTAPDPVDFRSFTGPDLTKYPPQNAYADGQSHEYNLVRMGGKDIMLVRQYAQQERVLGYYGGQFASFNAVFSPKGPDGQPLKLFDIATGRIDASVQKEWERYDISRLLRDHWRTLGPKLRGKLHVIVGTADTFHLDEATRLLDAELKKLGSDAQFTYVEGRNHFDLYEGGLGERIAKEMYRVARPKERTTAATGAP